jgi:farnesyl diphosphate synthase
MLVEQGVEHLSSHGEEADLLRSIAAFTAERDR